MKEEAKKKSTKPALKVKDLKPKANPVGGHKIVHENKRFPGGNKEN